MSKRRKWAITAIILFAIFIAYTIIIKFIDVSAIGPDGSKVGLSSLNLWFQEKIGENDTWYEITQNLGVILFFYVIFYAFTGATQLIKGKKIKKVDKKILTLGGLYIAIILFYVLFEKIVINYRPIMLDSVLEPSYPSSHTMLALCICISSIIMGNYYIKDQDTKKLYDISTIVLMFLTVVGRILSGVHWLTDIIGAFLLSAALLSLFYAFICHFEQEKRITQKIKNLFTKKKKKKE